MIDNFALVIADLCFTSNISSFNLLLFTVLDLSCPTELLGLRKMDYFKTEKERHA